jgi:hypothetical protein
MPSFRIALLREHMIGPYADISTIVETGTCRGEGTQVMAAHFDRVYTIELDPTLHAATQARLGEAGCDNITFIQGDSATELKVLVNALDGPAVFFLDAHWSGDATVDWESSDWKGYGLNTAHAGDSEQPDSHAQVPLAEEFDAIANHFPHRAIIYVDDMDKFDWLGRGKKDNCFLGEDWSHLRVSKLKAALQGRIDKWKRQGSQLFIRVKPR